MTAQVRASIAAALSRANRGVSWAYLFRNRNEIENSKKLIKHGSRAYFNWIGYRVELAPSLKHCLHCVSKYMVEQFTKLLQTDTEQHGKEIKLCDIRRESWLRFNNTNATQGTITCMTSVNWQSLLAYRRLQHKSVLESCDPELRFSCPLSMSSHQIPDSATIRQYDISSNVYFNVTARLPLHARNSLCCARQNNAVKERSQVKIKHAIKYTIKLKTYLLLQLQQAAAIKHKTSPARLAQLLHSCRRPH